jgi:hypothetical protein
MALQQFTLKINQPKLAVAKLVIDKEIYSKNYNGVITMIVDKIEDIINVQFTESTLSALIQGGTSSLETNVGDKKYTITATSDYYNMYLHIDKLGTPAISWQEYNI